ncbi:C40 family peptidase [Chryseobacterium sp. T1]
MKIRILFYAVAVISTFSLQSCVSNYVVSQPNIYKTDAKLASLDIKKPTITKDANKIGEAMVSLNNGQAALKNSIIEDAIKHERTIDNILNEASTYLGTPYRYGGTTRNGIDCSAFVLSVFGAAVGMNLPRVAAEQSQEGDSIDKTELKRGDLVFFAHGRGRISHVGIVEEVTAEGEIKFIHAATSRGVMVSSLNDKYWGPKYKFAKRVVKENGLNN